MSSLGREHLEIRLTGFVSTRGAGPTTAAFPKFLSLKNTRGYQKERIPGTAVQAEIQLGPMVFVLGKHSVLRRLLELIWGMAVGAKSSAAQICDTSSKCGLLDVWLLLHRSKEPWYYNCFWRIGRAPD